MCIMAAAVGFGPTNAGFKDLCLNQLDDAALYRQFVYLPR